VYRTVVGNAYGGSLVRTYISTYRLAGFLAKEPLSFWGNLCHLREGHRGEKSRQRRVRYDLRCSPRPGT
jgi:hypothetical protein